MEYTLYRAPSPAPCPEQQKRSMVPPKPGKGQRQPRPYSADDLNALWATSHSVDWLAMVTLNPPPCNRVRTWPVLRQTIKALKNTLTNWHRRKGFPSMILVTEFDPEFEGGELCANFHLGCDSPLSEEQQDMLRDWWMKRHGLEDNRGRVFQHDSGGGGEKLQDYLAKDISRRGGKRRYVKFPAPWLPQRTDCRLWFVVGIKRRPAREGAKMLASIGKRRSRFDREHAKTKTDAMTASTGTPDREHAPTYITTVAKAAIPAISLAS